MLALHHYTNDVIKSYITYIATGAAVYFYVFQEQAAVLQVQNLAIHLVLCHVNQHQIRYQILKLRHNIKMYNICNIINVLSTNKMLFQPAPQVFMPDPPTNRSTVASLDAYTSYVRQTPTNMMHMVLITVKLTNIHQGSK